MVSQQVGRPTRIAFGLGSSAEAMCLYSFGLLAMLYYNQVLGLSGTLAGLAPTLALLFDAISDPLMGSISDRFRSKRWGRRHPFMLIAPLPIALSFFAIFNPPESLSGYGLFAWFAGFSICLRTFMTLYHVPHLALGGELSSDYHERSAIMSYNNFFGWIGGASVHFVSLTFAFAATAEYANGLLNPDAYPVFALTASVVICVLLYASAFFTLNQIPRLQQPSATEPAFSFRAFVSDLRAVMTNRNYVFLLIALFLLSITLGTRATLNLYMNTYYFELVPSQIALMVIGSVVGYVGAFTLTAPLHRYFDKRATIVGSAVGLAIIPAMPVILRMLGIFPDNGDPWLLPQLLVWHGLGGGAGAILNISVMSALADVADENELLYGRRQEGTLYAARTFFAKADGALGHFIAGIALDLIAFPSNSTPGEVDESVIFNLGLVDSPLAIIPGLLGAMFYAGYRINRTRHQEIVAQLAERRSRSTASTQQAT